MFEQCLYPDSLHPQQLDMMLSGGWFRMGQAIFTTNFTLFNGCVYRTIWLRNALHKYDLTKTINILKKRNKTFRIELKKARITEAHEALFRDYKQGITFNAASSLDQLLNGYSLKPVTIYNSWEINLYDGNQLIGCSYFDIGEKSAQGISSYYHPDYKKHSLGRYMIYLQVEVCKGNEFEYYYPGYFVPGYKHLDYKLDIGTDCLEFLDPDDMKWKPIKEYYDKAIPLDMGNYFEHGI